MSLTMTYGLSSSSSSVRLTDAELALAVRVDGPGASGFGKN
jgi:hypothetical protein